MDRTIRMADLANAPRALRAAETAAVARVLASGKWILGPEVAAFEDEWASTCQTDAAVGTGNGLDALEIGLRALNLGPGDEIVTTSVTAFATVLAIIRAGCTPVLADIDPATALLDRESVERCLTPRTRAVVLVHLYGQVSALAGWASWAQERDLLLVEDCAQAHLASWDGQTAGSVGAFGAYSFYPTKNLGASGDAGALVTSDEALADRARRLRDYGRDGHATHTELGMNSRLDEIQAALLRQRLAWLPSFTLRRRVVADAYRAGISNPLVELLPMPAAPERHVNHLFVVRSARRDDLMAHLAGNSIHSLVHYPLSIHDQPVGRALRRDPAGLATATWHARQCLSIPCHPGLSDADVAHVITTINAFT